LPRLNKQFAIFFFDNFRFIVAAAQINVYCKRNEEIEELHPSGQNVNQEEEVGRSATAAVYFSS